MKTKLSFLFLVSCFFCLVSLKAQVPQGFNYQAIARDGTGAVLPNTSLQVMFYVQSLSTGGTLYWKEWHSSVTTNNFGLFNLVVGNGIRQTESTVATFNLIDWSVTPKYLKTEIYYSGSWKDMGTTQLMSVPYSMTAGDLAGTVDKLSVKGTTSGLEEALFEVKNKDGQTVFAVYNEGVRVYVSNGAKAVKGGFSVGGFGTDKAESTKYLFVGKDSVRIYLDTNPLTKGKKSGFAVGGYDLTKGTVQNYLDVNADSTRIYVDNNPSKGLKGGFAVGGFDLTKGPSVPFMSLTPTNYFLGHKSGINNTTGYFNSFFGYEAGLSNKAGGKNVFFGYQAGHTNSNGENNIFIGNKAGYSNTEGFQNVCIGTESGYSITGIGQENIFIGTNSGYNTTTGYYNCFIGNGAGFSNIAGTDNVYVGEEACKNNKSGTQNVIIGSFAGYKGASFSRSVLIGAQAGQYSSGSSNIYIGENAGRSNISIPETGSGFNTMVGSFSGEYIQTGKRNALFGFSSGNSLSSGSGNVFLGFSSGSSNNGDNNVFIGYLAGLNETGSNKLFIDNSGGDKTYALIYGEFDNKIIRLNSKIGINIDPTHLIHLSGGAYSDGAIWTNSSDRNLKENFEPVNGEMIINLIDQLPVTKWNYKTDNPVIKHIGPVAQDFYLLFSLGNNDTSISTVDPSGVALVAIKELSKQNKVLKEQIESYKSQLQSLQEKVDKIEVLLAKALDE
jgi:hypothetical protein